MPQSIHSLFRDIFPPSNITTSGNETEPELRPLRDTHETVPHSRDSSLSATQPYSGPMDRWIAYSGSCQAPAAAELWPHSSLDLDVGILQQRQLHSIPLQLQRYEIASKLLSNRSGPPKRAGQYQASIGLVLLLCTRHQQPMHHHYFVQHTPTTYL
ncbi:hypothetical protein HDV57DRAFT_201993 [Trichoderma longibrachiatum]